MTSFLTPIESKIPNPRQQPKQISRVFQLRVTASSTDRSMLALYMKFFVFNSLHAYKCIPVIIYGTVKPDLGSHSHACRILI